MDLTNFEKCPECDAGIEVSLIIRDDGKIVEVLAECLECDAIWSRYMKPYQMEKL